jgi:two-component system, OmpR family, alkaline phosphatase synthesis response regulator PhoP
MSGTILCVDLNLLTLGFLKALFDEAGFDTICASSGSEGLKQFFIFRPVAVITDLTMPNMDGFELCRRIREVSYAPIIVFTTVDQIDEKINAFEAGADDYVVKPASGRELVARVEVCLRRSRWPAAEESSSIYTDGRLTVDFPRRKVYVDGRIKDLTPIEFSLLTLFVQRPGDALSTKYLLANVWGGEYDTFDLVKWHISNLRKKLCNSKGKQFPITTIRGYGYRYESDPGSNGKEAEEEEAEV